MRDFLEAKKLSLDEFLEKLFSKERDILFPNNCFPTPEMQEEFLSRINEFNDKTIKSILRNFLIGNGSFGLDEMYAGILVRDIKAGTKKIGDVLKYEHGRRLLQKAKNKKFEVWEGLTWILDLLPEKPKAFLNILDNYLYVNFWVLPDNAITGLWDCMAIVRARYINYKHNKEVFFDIEPKDFERLVAKLYEEMGYRASLTQGSYDGGIDVIAKKDGKSELQTLLIQCKRLTTKNVSVIEPRALNGVVHSEKSTKGVIVTSTKFTSEAIKFAKGNASLELINGEDLAKLMNENFGIYWIHKIDEIISDFKNNEVK